MTLLLLAIPVEGLSALAVGLQKLREQKGAVMGPVLLLFPGVVAFLMTASEFALLKRTSVVTLSIAGIFKEVVTIATAGLIFDDRLTPINISGLFVTIGAIAAYNWIKIAKMRDEVIREVRGGYGVAGQGGSEDEDDDDDGGEDEWYATDGDADTGRGFADPEGDKTKRAAEVGGGQRGREELAS